MALWGRLGNNSDTPGEDQIPLELFDAVVDLWITGNANGGLTNGEALAALGLDADEQTQANRLKTAMNALATDEDRRAAKNHIRSIMVMHEMRRAPLNTGALVEQSLVDWFAAKSVTF